jgi:hypothetical protein
MKEIFKNIINNKDYELKDILNKIYEAYIKNKITKEDRDELENEARKEADPKNSYANQTDLINQLFERVAKLEEKVFAPKPTSPDGSYEEEEDKEEIIEEEYLEYVQPTGAHDAYKVGDKILFNNKKYICQMNGCVWDPMTYPQAWEIVE